MSVWGHNRLDRKWDDYDELEDSTLRRANHVILGSAAFSRPPEGLQALQELADLFQVRIEVVIFSSRQLRMIDDEEESSQQDPLLQEFSSSTLLCNSYLLEKIYNDPLQVALWFRNKGFPVHIMDTKHYITSNTSLSSTERLGNRLACQV